MGDTLGYVVVEYNQASHQPNFLLGADIHDFRGDAETEAEQQRAATARGGRRERYAVARVVIDDE